MKLTYILPAITTFFATTIAANAVTIFSSDFSGDAIANPAPDTLADGWFFDNVTSGNANSSTDSNEHRIFNPGTGGAGTNSNGWVSIVDGSSIGVTIALASLAGDLSLEDGGGNLHDSNVYSLSWVHATETSVASRISTFDVGVSSSGTISFLSGGNGDASQSLSALVDTGTNGGGSIGVTPERSWTLNFSGTGLTTADSITIDLGRNSSTAGFTLLDDIALDAVPEPSSAVLIGLGGLSLIFRRRK